MLESVLQSAARIAIRAAISTSRVKATYDNNSDPAVVIEDAGFGEMVIEAEGLEGQLVRINDSDARDLIVWPDDLLDASSVRITPEAGDRVTIEFPDTTTEEFEVAAFPPENEWRWTDRFETARRIHLKRIEVGS